MNAIDLLFNLAQINFPKPNPQQELFAEKVKDLPLFTGELETVPAFVLEDEDLKNAELVIKEIKKIKRTTTTPQSEIEPAIKVWLKQLDKFHRFYEKTPKQGKKLAQLTYDFSILLKSTEELTFKNDFAPGELFYKPNAKLNKMVLPNSKLNEMTKRRLLILLSDIDYE